MLNRVSKTRFKIGISVRIPSVSWVLGAEDRNSDGSYTNPVRCSTTPQAETAPLRFVPDFGKVWPLSEPQQQVTPAVIAISNTWRLLVKFLSAFSRIDIELPLGTWNFAIHSPPSSSTYFESSQIAYVVVPITSRPSTVHRWRSDKNPARNEAQTNLLSRILRSTSVVTIDIVANEIYILVLKTSRARQKCNDVEQAIALWYFGAIGNTAY